MTFRDDKQRGAVMLKPLTLLELRDKAQALLDAGTPPDTTIWAEGCDCTGKAHDLVLTPPGPRDALGSVELTRTHD